MRALPKFFAPPPDNDGNLEISGADGRHISKVLRMRKGEKLTVCDGEGFEFSCVITEISGDSVACRLLEKKTCSAEPDLFVTLCIAYPKSGKAELVIQKCTELGVGRIIPVFTARCVGKPDKQSVERKLERYRATALEAAKQSGRGRIPEIMPFMELDDALTEMKSSDIAAVLYEKAGNLALPTLKNIKSFSFLVGPEGGFEPAEIETCERAGLLTLGLGERILRCETAPIAFLSVLMYGSGNF